MCVCMVCMYMRHKIVISERMRMVTGHSVGVAMMDLKKARGDPSGNYNVLGNDLNNSSDSIEGEAKGSSHYHNNNNNSSSHNKSPNSGSDSSSFIGSGSTSTASNSTTRENSSSSETRSLLHPHGFLSDGDIEMEI